jgi:hypothetical protein
MRKNVPRLSSRVYMGLGSTQGDENHRYRHPRPASREGSTPVQKELYSSRHGGTEMTGGG